jgi:DNA-directed RNA polymerase subunit RPC12/RpoP
MTTHARAARWAARTVCAFTALVNGARSWLIGGALKVSKPASCPRCDTAHIESVTPRIYEPQSTWYRCSECGRIWSIPKPPTMPDTANNSRVS